MTSALTGLQLAERKVMLACRHEPEGVVLVDGVRRYRALIDEAIVALAGTVFAEYLRAAANKIEKAGLE